MIEFTKGIVCGHPELDKEAQDRSMKEITVLEKAHERLLRENRALQKRLSALEDPAKGKKILLWFNEGKHYLEPVNEVCRQIRVLTRDCKPPPGYCLRVTVDYACKDLVYEPE